MVASAKLQLLSKSFINKITLIKTFLSYHPLLKALKYKQLGKGARVHLILLYQLILCMKLGMK